MRLSCQREHWLFAAKICAKVEIYMIFFCSEFCAPYLRRVEPLTRLDTEGRVVIGVAELYDNIYAVFAGSNTIYVYSASNKFISTSGASNRKLKQPSYSRLSNVIVTEMEDPRGLAACLTTGHLYVADCSGQCIWQVTIERVVAAVGEENRSSADGNVVKFEYTAIKWAENVGRPRSLSLTAAGQVLLIDADSEELFVYNGRGEREATVSLRDKGILAPWHAIPASSSFSSTETTYLVCHGWANTQRHRVCEIDRDGHILRECGGDYGLDPGQLACPSYLAQGQGCGGGFVIDRHRVLALSRDRRQPRLCIQRVVSWRPNDADHYWTLRRLCYTVTSGRLLVVWQEGFIDVIRVSS